MPIKISVVIPAFNAEGHISNAIKSVIGQEFPSHEIIVVDDGSTDNTKKVVEQFSLANIKYLFQKNGGPSIARNNGILHASGDYIAFLDADDIWYPNHLLDAYNFFKENQNVFWFSSAFDIDYGRNKIITRGIKTKDDTIDYVKSSLKCTFVHTSAVVIHYSVFTNIGLFNENWKFGEDLNLWVRIALTYPNIGYSKKPGSIFRKTIGSLTFDKTNYDLKNTLKVLYFTDKEVKLSGNKQNLKLVNQWIEDAVYSAILRKNNLILKYIKSRWVNRIGILTKLMLIAHHFLPLKCIKIFNYHNKILRKLT